MEQRHYAWALKRKELLKVTRMMMIRMKMNLAEGTKNNPELRHLAGVEGIENKLRDARLRWYGHGQRREKS